MYNPCKTKPCQYLCGIAIFLLIFYKGLYIFTNWNTHTLCHYSDAGDVLPSAEDPRFSPNNRSIFFHETSCRGGLTQRQACAVEAASRAHPQWQVYVLFSSPVTHYTLKTSCLAKLLEFDNIHFARVHIAEYSRGTSVQSILLNGLKKSKYPVHHLADILRILTLNKWGGIYLDSDMIVTRSLEYLPLNFVAKENRVDMASGILSFTKDGVGKKVTNAIIKQIYKHFYPRYWTANGPYAIEEVLYQMCPNVMFSVNYKSKPIVKCKDVSIFDSELFYPLYYTDWDEYFELPDEDTFDLERPYTYHMWNNLTSNRTISNNTVYEIIAKKFCPTIHNTYHDEFGAK